MSEREGPAISLSCHGCTHYRQVRYRVQGDSGYDKSCAAFDPPKGMPEIGDTPEWCPRPLRSQALDDADLAVLEQMRAEYALQVQISEGLGKPTSGIDQRLAILSRLTRTP